MRRLLALAALLASLALAQSKGPAPSPAPAAALASPLDTFMLRVGAPVLTHGPGYDTGDVMPAFIQTGPRSFYAYGANQASWGSQVSSLTQNTGTGGANGANCATAPADKSRICSNLTQAFPFNAITAVAPSMSTDECGQWPTSFHKVGSTYYAFVHNEGPCDYAKVQTNESMSMWTSPTGAPGSWSPMAVPGLSSGTVVSSLEPSEAHWLTGFGDATMLPSADGRWMYAYLSFFCDSSVCDYHNVVARAPMNALGPGNWRMFYQGCFCEPALNNAWDATKKLPHADLSPLWIGSSVATMPGTPYTAIAIDAKNHAYSLATSETYNGMAISIALDYVHFTTLHAPIVNYDFQNFAGRPVPDDLYLYAILRDGTNGGSVLNSKSFGLWAIYVPPNNGLGSRYVINWPVTMSERTRAMRNAGMPQVAITLETYTNTSTGQPYSGHLRSTTVNPFAGISSDGATETGWAAQSFLGYILTACPASKTINQCDANGAQTANRIEECWSGSAADDYQLHIDTNGTAGSCPTGWTHVRTSGWLYKSPQAFPTRPVYICKKTVATWHFSSNDPACNGETVLGLLGYSLES